MRAIEDFNGIYQFLNNDYPAWVQQDGLLFPSLALAFQAARAQDAKIKKQLAECEDYGKFVQLIRSFEDPPDWRSKRLHIMERLVRDKFLRNKGMRQRLLDTGEAKLVNRYSKKTGSEQYWGVVEGKGQNHLGRILQRVREDCKRGIQFRRWCELTLNVEKDSQLFPEIVLKAMKDGRVVELLKVHQKANAVCVFGSLKECTYELAHPSISRRHAALVFVESGKLFLVDAGSTAGTTVNEEQCPRLAGIQLKSGDTVRFGNSSRRYIVEIDRQKMFGVLKRRKEETESDLQRIRRIREVDAGRARSRSRERQSEKQEGAKKKVIESEVERRRYQNDRKEPNNKR